MTARFRGLTGEKQKQDIFIYTAAETLIQPKARGLTIRFERGFRKWTE